MKKLFFITFNAKPFGCATDITSMVELDAKGRDRRNDNYASLADGKLLVNDAAYIRDVMARFGQIGFDGCRPDTAKHRILQAAKK